MIIVCIFVVVIAIGIGITMIIFPDFWFELLSIGDNQFLYWIGAGYTSNPTKGTRILSRIVGSSLIAFTIIIVLWLFVF